MMPKDEQKTILSARDLQSIGFSRAAAYQLLNRADLPVIRIGSRRFLHRQLFEDWLVTQATGNKETHE